MNSKLEVLPAGRDLRLDSLRGLLIVFMTVNHMPTELRAWTDQSLGIFTSAEGFMFLSGLLAGIVYTKKLRTLGTPGLRAAAVKRSQTIYFWHVGSFVAAFALVQLTMRLFGYCSETSPQLFYEHPLLALGLGGTLLYQPGLLDLLPMYCVFLMLIPAVLPALEAGKRMHVLAISGLVWLIAQWSPPIDGAPIYPINVGTFNLFGWQFLFVLGIMIGHARASGIAQVSRPNPGVLLAAMVVAVYGWGIHHLHWYRPWPDAIFGMFVNKPVLGLFRMADFGCVAYLIAVVAQKIPSLVTWRPLALLGRNSLQVVAAQSIIVMMLLQFSALFTTELRRSLTAAAAIGMLLAAAGLYRMWQVAHSDHAEITAIGSRQTPSLPLDSPHDFRAA